MRPSFRMKALGQVVHEPAEAKVLGACFGSRRAMLGFAVGTAALVLSGCGGGGGGKSGGDVVALAKKRFAEAKEGGADMSRGPCLGVIKRGWVADVAHDPRQPVDDLPQNQCAAFRNGEASHFVELDPSGDLIRKS